MRSNTCHTDGQRTAGTTALIDQHRDAISRRDFRHLVQEERDHKLLTMPRIHWLKPGTAWSIDAAEYQGRILVPLWILLPAAVSIRWSVTVALVRKHSRRK